MRHRFPWLAGLMMVITGLTGISPVPLHAQSTVPLAPFVYYYSEHRAAFIVERADGSDSRILAAFSYPVDTPAQEIDGPGWSPSGQWFAWNTRAYSDGGTGTGASPAWVIQRDGRNQHAFLNGITGIDKITWSPVADLLLIQRILSTVANPLDAQVEIDLYDPATMRYRALGVGSNSTAHWTTDGRFVVIEPGDNDPLCTVRIFSVASSSLDTRSFTPDSSCDMWWSGGTAAAFVRAGDKSVVVEDFLDGSTLLFPIIADSIQHVDWSPDSLYALIYVDHDCPDCQTGRRPVWLLSHPDNRLVEISQDSDLLNGEVASELHFSSNWSPDSRYALIVTMDEQPVLVAVAPYRLTDLSATSDLPTHGVLDPTLIGDWRYGRDQIGFIWDVQESNSGNIISSSVYRYNAANSKLAVVITLPGETIHYYAISSDQRYIAYSTQSIGTDNSDNPIMLNFRDTATGSTVRVKSIKINYPNAYTYIPDDFEVTAAFWHPHENWAIIFGRYHNLRIEPAYLNVVNADLTVQRDIGFNCEVASCFGWLPDLVKY